MTPLYSQENIKKSFKELYAKHGATAAGMAMASGRERQFIRFKILAEGFLLRNKKVLDIGCGVGDLFYYLNQQEQDIQYRGVDLVDDYIGYAVEQYKDNKKNASFVNMDFLQDTCDDFEPDICMLSGAINLKLDNHPDHYEFAWDMMKKAFDLSCEGIAFNYISDKVNYQDERSFHYNPGKTLEMAYGLTRNIVFRNDYFPFEFTIYAYKDQQFPDDDLTFAQYRKNGPKYSALNAQEK